MAIDMRHSKLTPEEAALLAGEVQKPNWQSKNEGIHERVSFEDTIWGFDLAGGSYYQTPLRVVGVKKGSRAEKAGIRLGDKLKRINDIETSTLTIQEAHEIILTSGVHLKIAVTAPEDEEDAYFCYEDQLESGYDSDEERRRLEEKIKKRQVHAKVSSYWSLQWPWVSKRRVIYRESNCFMVPSKYENNHKEKFPSQPFLRVEDDIVLQKAKNAKELEENDILNSVTENNLTNGDVANESTKPLLNCNVENSSDIINDNSLINKNERNQDNKIDFNELLKDNSNLEDEEINYRDNKNETEKKSNIEKEISHDKINETSHVEEEITHNEIEEATDYEREDTQNEVSEDLHYEEYVSNDEDTEDKTNETSDVEAETNHDEIEEETGFEHEDTQTEVREAPNFEEYTSNDEATEEIEDKTSTINDETSTMNDIDIISQEDEVIKGLADDGDLSTDDERLLDSILSDGVDSRRNNGESER